MKIYTRTGDTGETALIGGERVRKTDERIETIGSLDELNAAVGYLVSLLPAQYTDIVNDLEKVQHRLFDIGAIIANQSQKIGRSVSVPFFNKSNIDFLEARIDLYTQELTQLTAFILPGGTAAAAQAHVVRSVCRRSERQLMRLLETQGTVQPDELYTVLSYVNRLSDFFFTTARTLNQRAQRPDVIWLKETVES